MSKNDIINSMLKSRVTLMSPSPFIALYDKDDNLIQRYEYTDGRVPTSMTYNSTKYYLHYDQVGSLRAVSDTSGNIVKEITYDTYGNILSDTNTNFKVPFGFAGGLYDTDTKLVRFGYRDYDSYTGKWTAKDPIDFSGGDTNLYGYVLGDPVGFVDPEGKNPIIILIGLYFLLGDEWLNAPGFGDVPQEGMTPMNEVGLCMVSGSFAKNYFKRNYQDPHNEYGPHIHWGPKRNSNFKAPRKWHVGPKNPNHGQPKGQSGWQGWGDWWSKGGPWGWK